MATDPNLYSPGMLAGLAELTAAFERHGVKYALIGGLAVSLRGDPRTTRDIELLLAVPQLALPGLVADLAARGFTLDETTVVTEFVHHHMTAFDYGGVRVDWLKPVLPAYQHVLDNAVMEDGFGQPVRVAAAEGLLLLKVFASRPRDLIDIDGLLDANRGRLDLAWVEQEWLTIFPTDDPRWLRFRQAVAEHYDRPAPAD